MKIFTYAYNNPKYLEYQIKCLNKFAKDNFNFVCIDNSVDINISNKFKNICNQYNIEHLINLKPDYRFGGNSHYAALQWSYDNHIKNYKGIIVMLDHDIFPISNLSFSEILGNNDIAGCPQSRGHVNYLHPAFIMMNMESLPNKDTIGFNGLKIDNYQTDVGGELHFYFEKNKNLKIKRINHYEISSRANTLQALPQDFIKKYSDDNYFDYIYNCLLHVRIGSNWSNIEKNKFDTRENYIYSLLDYYLSK